MERIIAEALKRGKAEQEKGYIRFRESFRKIERGTVIIGKRVIWGFPHIKRIFTLEKGLQKNISDDTVYVEEKIDGFNVRIASVRGKLAGFSRGGFLDAFVTEKAREMGLEKFFKDHPGHVLCAEMLGNTPYTDPTDDYDVKLFVFDIDPGDGSYLPPKERYDILKRYGIESTPKLGKFARDDYPGLGRLAKALNKGQKEGMVIKSADRKTVVKYVTPWADIDDIARTSHMFFDMPIGFYYQRVLRSAMFMDDFGFDRDRYAGQLGKAFYSGLTKAIRDAKDGKEIDEEFEVLIKDDGIWEGIKDQMSKDVKVEKLWEREDKGRKRIRFRKIYKRTTKRLTSYVEGKGITD